MAERGVGRRSVLAAMAAGGVLPGLGACSDDGKREHGKRADAAPAAGVIEDGQGGMDVLMIIRHAEKPTGSGAPYGITADGKQDDHSLTVQGWTRAGALVRLFDPRDSAGAPVALRAGLARPAAVVAAAAGSGGSNSKRPSETVTPAADALGVSLKTPYSVGQEAELAAWLTGSTGPSGPTLVAWEHSHIADIVANLGTVTPKPPNSWPGDRFDVVYVFTRPGGGSGWTFTQVPQSLLAGDSPKPIS